MKTVLVKSFVLGIVMSAIVSVSAFADDSSFDYSGNFSSAGDDVVCENLTALDVFVAGQDIKVDEVGVKNNIFAAGGKIEILDSELGSDIFAAGNSLDVSNTVTEGNVFLAGNYVNFGEASEAASLFACGNDMSVEGSCIEGVIAGNKVYFNGYVEGDLDIDGDTVIIGDDAYVGGELSVKSKTVELSDNADVADYSWEYSGNEEAQGAVKKVSILARAVSKISSLLYWIPAALVLCLILCGLCGKQLDEAKDYVKTKSGEMVLWGVASWALIPAVCLIIGITVIGLPLAAVICAIYVVLLCVGLPFAGASIGRLCFPKLHPILASVIGVAIIECVRIIPIIGTIVGIAGDMYLLGYAVRKIYLSKSKKIENEN